jgi:hypothetical protein
MADTADRILADLRSRRDELRPLVDELERIEAAIDALERAEAGSGNGSSASASTAARQSPGRRRRRRRPSKGEPNRTDQFLDLIRRGAISIPAAAREMGIGPNYLYRIAATLESEGKIAKQGREYVMNAERAPTVGDLVTDEGVNEGTRENAADQRSG